MLTARLTRYASIAGGSLASSAEHAGLLSRLVIDVECVDDGCQNTRVRTKKENSILLRRLAQEVMDADQCCGLISNKYFVKLRKSHVSQMRLKDSLSCTHLIGESDINAVGEPNAAACVDKLTLKYSLPSEVALLIAKSQWVQRGAFDH
ncbi:hypothetical protein [Stenotrophomonas pavanii]|uniref:hypothetical protein n=1 Tax=Stenotrophomonas pavanii TaxID=487698 RepID=UPI0039C6603F